MIRRGGRGVKPGRAVQRPVFSHRAWVTLRGSTGTPGGRISKPAATSAAFQLPKRRRTVAADGCRAPARRHSSSVGGRPCSCAHDCKRSTTRGGGQRVTASGAALPTNGEPVFRASPGCRGRSPAALTALFHEPKALRTVVADGLSLPARRHSATVGEHK